MPASGGDLCCLPAAWLRSQSLWGLPHKHAERRAGMTVGSDRIRGPLCQLASLQMPPEAHTLLGFFFWLLWPETQGFSLSLSSSRWAHHASLWWKPALRTRWERKQGSLTVTITGHLSPVPLGTRAGSPLECSPPTPLWCSSGSSEEDKNWRTQPPRGHVLFHKPSIFISFQVSSRNWLLYFTQMFSVVISRGDRSALLHLRTRSQKNLYVKLNIYGHTWSTR